MTRSGQCAKSHISDLFEGIYGAECKLSFTSVNTCR